MGFDDDLVLGLGFPCTEPKKPTTTTVISRPPPPPEQILNFEPSLTLSLLGEPYDEKVCEELVEEKKVISNEQYPPLDHHHNLYRQDSAASSFSNSISVKRERENNNGGGGYGGDQEVEIERVNSSRASDEDEDAFNAKKKLRLTKAQSAMLEESFKHRSTLNPKQKQDLAKELKLRPRQVEVWFQNRRARTKLKQTEVDCEFLKKCCETLTEENRRLQKELQELKALKLASNPYCMQLPPATLTMCPSCERIVGAGENASSKIPFSIAPAAGKPHLFNPFAKAC